ncbi:hypothetical protein [Luteimonas aquatica]|uniref:hypothetical protein n=1 Tax=Luteimonas aquatica TaxID=450364 RepID=UPI001F5A1818|nr:hypothetical protein [Luteimonas aquatica]
MTAPPPLPPVPRSTFVTLLAWITLGLVMLGVLVLAVEMAAFAAVSRSSGFSTLYQQFLRDPQMAQFVSTLLRWLPVLLAVIAAQTVLTLTASIGLLKRRDWARKLFIVLLLIAAAGQFATLPMQWALSDQFQGFVLHQPMPPEMRVQMQMQIEGTRIATRIFGVAIAAVFSGLFGWLAWKLHTPRIRAEFGAADAGIAVPLA